jgi:hypothetical protein
MFGCLAVYIAEKIVFILRHKREHAKHTTEVCGRSSRT